MSIQNKHLVAAEQQIQLAVYRVKFCRLQFINNFFSLQLFAVIFVKGEGLMGIFFGDDCLSLQFK